VRNLPIPAKTLTQHIAVLGKTRAGKSTVMRVITEDLLEAEKPVCIVDPKGDWWGLKSSADGKSAGFPVVIFGGDHADVPINEHSGAHVAELVATGNRPCIIDLGGWMPGERTRFWVAFASNLFKLTRGLRWLVIDEIHNFAPKGAIMMKGDENAAKALHWTNRLASEGLGKGVHLIFASQRPQKVHNDTLTSAETLIAMRVLHPSDRDAVAEWIKGCGDPKLGAEVMASLADLSRGEGWVWSPEIGFGPKRVQFPMFRTYDSFKAQPGEAKAQLVGWATVDLDEVRAKLAAVVQEAKANDPSELRREIARLRKELGAKGKDTTAIVEVVKGEHLEAARAQGYEAAKSAFANSAEKFGEENYAAGVGEGRASVAKEMLMNVKQMRAMGVHDLAKAIDRLAVTLEKLLSARQPPRPTAIVNIPVYSSRRVARRETAPITVKTPGAAITPVEANRANGHLPGPQQRILDSLAWWEAVGVARPTRTQVAVAARYSPNGGAFSNPLGTLRTNSMIDYPDAGHVTLTDAGRALANSPGEPPTADELHMRLQGILNGPERRILEPLIKAYPDPMSRDDLAAAAGYSPDGGAFCNPLGALRSLGLIDYPTRGQVVALPILFPG
jgi:uncharacterized protein